MSIATLFAQVLGVAISTALLAYLLMFPTFLSYLKSNHLDRLTFDLTHFVPLACIIVLTLSFKPDSYPHLAK